jgi:ubiquinone/menaquinone biosynthesis C-methylase UbiE
VQGAALAWCQNKVDYGPTHPPVEREQLCCELFVLADDPGNLPGAIRLFGWRQSRFPEATRPTVQMRNPVSSAKSPAHLVSKSARRMGTADLENTPRGQPPGTKRRAPWSRFRGVVTTPSYSTTDIRSFFDQCASTGSPEQHGHAQRLLEYRLALVRNLARPRSSDVVLDLGCGNGHHLLALAPEVARGIGVDVSPGMIELARARLRNSPCGANLTFEVDNAEELNGIADQSVDLAICIGAFEHMLDKRAVLAGIHRVLKFGGRFFCLTLHADYVWYRTIAPVLGFSTKHLSSDRMLTHDEFSALLDQAGFRRIRSAPWTFIPKGDVPALVALLLTILDAIGRHARLDSFRGGLSLCAWKEATPT